MRSPVWFVVAAVIAVAGFAGAVFYLMPRLAAADARMMRVVVPGNAMLVFDKPGPYMIYHEKKGTVDGRYYDSESVNGLQLGLTADATGAHVKLVDPSPGESYKIGNRSGESIYAFTLDQPGLYRLHADLAGSSKAVVTINQGSLVAATFRTILGALGIAFGGLAVAGAIVFVVVWQRIKAAKPVATG
jgi:hypothetical protein